MHNPYDKMIQDDTARQYRYIRQVLYNGRHPPVKPHSYRGFIQAISIILVLMTIILVKGCEAPAMAYSVDQLATAIYHAENSRTWPYGIKHHYRHTSARQACVNTIVHRYRLWDKQGDFISYLQKSYCPINSDTDDGTCQYWTKNVKYNLNKGDD